MTNYALLFQILIVSLLWVILMALLYCLLKKRCWLILHNISAGIRQRAEPIRVLLPISWSEQVGREPLFQLCHESRGTLTDIESRQIKHSQGTPSFWSLICETDRVTFVFQSSFGPAEKMTGSVLNVLHVRIHSVLSWVGNISVTPSYPSIFFLSCAQGHRGGCSLA